MSLSLTSHFALDGTTIVAIVTLYVRINSDMFLHLYCYYYYYFWGMHGSLDKQLSHVHASMTYIKRNAAKVCRHNTNPSDTKPIGAIMH